MKKKFSAGWRKSKKPSKQRKYRMNAPMHIKQKFVHCHLSSELRKKYSMRNTSLRKGDKVRIMRGKLKKHEGKVESIELKECKVFVSGSEITKKDGSKRMIAIHPSNLMITELGLDDKLRQKSLERN